MWIVIVTGGVLVFFLLLIVIASVVSNASKSPPEPSAGEGWRGETEYRNKHWERIVMGADLVFNEHGNLRKQRT